MKRLKYVLTFIFSCAWLILLCACQGNYGSIDLNKPIDIPDNGIVKAEVFQQIKADNAIAVFKGSSNGFDYEWTIFAQDIKDPKDANLSLSIRKDKKEEIKLSFKQKKNYQFKALLSIHIDELWDAQSASAYNADKAIASVSLTGSKATILNLTLDKPYASLIIRPDETVATEDNKEIKTPTDDSTGENTDENVADSGTYDGYSEPEEDEGNVYINGKDKYMTDPIPEGKPKPVEPENQSIDEDKTLTCTFSIECSTILNNLDDLDPDKLEMVPSSGIILPPTTVTFYEGESVYDVLLRICKEKNIHMESSWTPIYNSAYVEGIHNLYEFDCGALSGWMYKVDGWYPNYGCSRYQLKQGNVVEWRYTCDLGNDIGGGYAMGG